MLILFLRRSLAYLTDCSLMLFVRPAHWIVGELSPLQWFGWGLLAIGIVAFYVVGCHARWGCTFGKLLFGLRVASLDGCIPPPLKSAFLRAVPLLVFGNLDFLLVSTFGPASWSEDICSLGQWHLNICRAIAMLWICADVAGALFTGARRSLHDILGNTIVMREKDLTKR
jgi:uncharacterized RDD family membrane protein YckC